MRKFSVRFFSFWQIFCYCKSNQWNKEKEVCRHRNRIHNATKWILSSAVTVFSDFLLYFIAHARSQSHVSFEHIGLITNWSAHKIEAWSSNAKSDNRSRKIRTSNLTTRFQCYVHIKPANELNQREKIVENYRIFCFVADILRAVHRNGIKWSVLVLYTRLRNPYRRMCRTKKAKAN